MTSTCVGKITMSILFSSMRDSRECSTHLLNVASMAVIYTCCIAMKLGENTTASSPDTGYPTRARSGLLTWTICLLPSISTSTFGPSLHSSRHLQAVTLAAVAPALCSSAMSTLLPRFKHVLP